MTAWSSATDYIDDIEERRTTEFGLNSILGVTLGEPVYTPSQLRQLELFTADENAVYARRRVRNPQKRTWSSSKPDTLLHLLELPRVTAQEIRAAGFEPEWERET